MSARRRTGKCMVRPFSSPLLNGIKKEENRYLVHIWKRKEIAFLLLKREDQQKSDHMSVCVCVCV